ncbi:unnamed protein product [Penicillium salamii]|uniref:Uncharacterized protein n=1 Tax=Penicillium salamii TaxID=1612424 RepID=A0A9W4JLL8_9EURO|nr:unnamed protein product [Penicillium salamii]CAG8039490.1 unnamed protein product [Penicillium salamii]CAG8052214.1 unnamed protein product [Penicillium salamii]CAG8117471.1 unnamed protein product [Penicillium salamii]CAG8257651.1 unnamed protein product [Penicillium salamii]
MVDADMDQFAQTRGGDDLFDDEIIPVPAEEQHKQTEVIAREPEPEGQEVHVPEAVTTEKTTSRGDTPQRGRGGERGRGRRNRGKGGRGGREPDQRPSARSSRKKKETSVPAADARDASPKPDGTDESKEQLPVEDANGEEAAIGADAQRVPAVRGDRSATGGLRKPKLTEEELSKRIAAAKENAVKKAAAHARAEADHASFVEREQEAAKKRREELAHRRVMDNEREQNRQRKLKAQTGREWDSQKREEDYNPRGGGSQFRRGMHGGVSGHARQDFEGSRVEGAADNAGGQRGRGRGGRGGRSRGSPHAAPAERSANSKGLSGSMWADSPAQPVVDDKDEFPALPEGPTQANSKSETKLDTKNEAKPEVQPAPEPSKPLTSLEKLDSTFSPITGSWADQFDDE